MSCCLHPVATDCNLSMLAQILRQLRTSVSSGGNALSEAEMDRHTIRGLREDAAAEGRVPKPLVRDRVLGVLAFKGIMGKTGRHSFHGLAPQDRGVFYKQISYTEVRESNWGSAHHSGPESAAAAALRGVPENL